MRNKPVYKRVVLKLSGEALQGRQAHGIDASILDSLAEQIAEIRRMGQLQEMTSGELAEHMGVTKRTLRRWRESGALAPCGTRGREPVWSVLDVRRAAERFGR